MKVNIRAKESTVDAAGWTLVGIVVVAGLYACFLFESFVGGLASAILNIFF